MSEMAWRNGPDAPADSPEPRQPEASGPASDEAICPECTSLVRADDVLCLQCGAAPGEEGWRALKQRQDPWLGATLAGKYRLVQPLGSGAMARVYRARHRLHDADYAVKLIDLGRAPDDEKNDAPGYRQRARREAAVLARVTSPHVVDIHDVVEPGNRHIALVMEYVCGTNLYELLQRDGPMGWARAVRLGADLAFAVASVHDCGAIHRDIKPENIVVASDAAGEDMLKLLDFGLTRQTADTKRTTGFVGTPVFASPEQLQHGRDGPEADVFAVGATLFAMLAARPPIDEPTITGLAAAYEEHGVPRVGEVVDRPVPAALEGVLADLMARDPAERPDDLRGVARRLQRIAASQTHPGPPPPRSPADDGDAADSREAPLRDVSHHDGRTLRVVAETDGGLRFTWSEPEADDWRTLSVDGEVCAVDGCARAARIAVGHTDGRITLRAIDADIQTHTVEAAGRPCQLNHSPDGYLLAVQTDDGHREVFCMSSGELVHRSCADDAADDVPVDS